MHGRAAGPSEIEADGMILAKMASYHSKPLNGVIGSSAVSVGVLPMLKNPQEMFNDA